MTWKNRLDRLTQQVFSPVGLVVLFAVVLTTFYTVQCSCLQNVLGLDVLETITWGARQTLGQTKHPPLSGYLGYAISALGNHADWIMYLAAQLCIALGVWFSYRCSRLFLDENRAAVSALLLYFLFYYNPSETRFCTYTLEILLTPLASFFFFRALRDDRLADYLTLGVLAATGLLNKYSFALVLLAFAVIVLKNPAYRRRLCGYKLYLAMLLALALLSPHLIWLYQHDFSCLHHVGSRINHQFRWYMPLSALGSAIYPYAMMFAALFLACLPDWKRRRRIVPDTKVAVDALLIGALPSAVLVLLTLCGKTIVAMWFCTMASLAGLAVVAFFPFEIDLKTVRRLAVYLAVFSLVMFTATTLDVLYSSRVHLHADPQDYVQLAEQFFQKHTDRPIPLVAGAAFESSLLENYLPHRPPSLSADDELALELYRDKIFREGALLIGSEEELQLLCDQLNCRVKWENYHLPYHALLGRTRRNYFFMAYLPPQSQPEAGSPR